MSPVHEAPVGASVEWYTPKSLFDALGRDLGHSFDLDPACAHTTSCRVPHLHRYSADGQHRPWHGHVWLNPPYGRSGVVFIDRMIAHGDGLMLLPSRTETAVYQRALAAADAVCFLRDRLWFVRNDGVTGRSSFGSTLFAFGDWAARILQAADLGFTFEDLVARVQRAEAVVGRGLKNAERGDDPSIHATCTLDDCWVTAARAVIGEKPWFGQRRGSPDRVFGGLT